MVGTDLLGESLADGDDLGEGLLDGLGGENEESASVPNPRVRFEVEGERWRYGRRVTRSAGLTQERLHSRRVRSSLWVKRAPEERLSPNSALDATRQKPCSCVPHEFEEARQAEQACCTTSQQELQRQSFASPSSTVACLLRLFPTTSSSAGRVRRRMSRNCAWQTQNETPSPQSPRLGEKGGEQCSRNSCQSSSARFESSALVGDLLLPLYLSGVLVGALVSSDTRPRYRMLRELEWATNA